MAHRLVQPFLHRQPYSVPILYNGPPFAQKIVHYHTGCWSHLL